MPKLGLTMTEGVLSSWAVAPGEAFAAGDVLYVIESDKVATEVQADAAGVLAQIAVEPGDTVPVGSVIGYFEAPEASAGVSPANEARAPVQSVSAAPVSAGEWSAAASAAEQGAQRKLVTPYARKLARQLQVNLSAITGSGPRGRVRAKDVLEAESAADTLIRPSAIQATMARRLSAAKQQVPHFYLALEANVGALLALRAEINAKADGVRLTLTHFVVAAIANALCELPEANRVWTEEGIRAFRTVDVGIAVDTERGLLVPVLRDAARLPIAEIATRAKELVDKARRSALTADEMAGGAISVSNAGMHNVTYLTPIINPGQAMILGVGSVRPVFRPDETGHPTLRNELGLVLAADHRILDGVAGLRALNAIVARLEHPEQLISPNAGAKPIA